MSSAPTSAPGDLVSALRRAGLTDVDDSRLARTLYSSDASVYRLEPRVDEIHQMVGRILDEQRQSRGLLSRMARGLKISTRFRERDE